MKLSTESRPGRLVALLILVVTLAGPAAGEDLNRIVLRVNDQILTLFDYEVRKSHEIAAILASEQLGDQERQEQLARLGPQLMQQMFQELLLMSRAKQMGVNVSDTAIGDAVHRVQEQQGLTDEVDLMRALASAGMTLDELRENLRRDLTWNEVIGREVTGKIEVGEEQLRAHYRENLDRYRIPEKRHLEEVIVLDSGEAPAEELARLAGEIRDQVAAWAELEATIEPYREAGRTTGVVDLGWLEHDELDAALAEAGWSLQAGELSTPIESRGGWHVLRLAGVEEATVRPFAEVQDEILRRERASRFDQQMRTFMAELERTAFIREDLPPEAVGYRSLSTRTAPEDELERFRRPGMLENAGEPAAPAADPGSD